MGSGSQLLLSIASALTVSAWSQITTSSPSQESIDVRLRDYAFCRAYNYAYGQPAENGGELPGLHIPIEIYPLDRTIPARQHSGRFVRHISLRAASRWRSVGDLGSVLAAEQNRIIHELLVVTPSEAGLPNRVLDVSSDSRRALVRSRSKSDKTLAVELIDLESGHRLTHWRLEDARSIGGFSGLLSIGDNVGYVMLRRSADTTDDVQLLDPGETSSGLLVPVPPGPGRHSQVRSEWVALHKNGTTRPVPDSAFERLAASPDGQRLIRCRRSGSRTIQVEQCSPDLVYSHWRDQVQTATDSAIADVHVRWSEDGRLVCVWASKNTIGWSTVFVFDAREGELLGSRALRVDPAFGGATAILKNPVPDDFERALGVRPLDE
jgi:hypothetical protein